MVGIYKITNMKNNKIYIGESVNINKRWNYHKEKLNNNSHNNIKLQKDWNIYKEYNFKFEIIKDLTEYDIPNYIIEMVLLVYEDKYIKEYNSVEEGYNNEYTLDKVLNKEKDLNIIKNLGNYGLKILNNIIEIFNNNNGEYTRDTKILKEINCNIKEDYFIKLPNNLIWTISKEEIPLCNLEENKLLLPTIIYLGSQINKVNKCVFSLEDLIKSVGFKPRTGKDNSIHKFKKILNIIQKFNWLSNEIDYNNIKLKDLIKTNFNIKCDKNENNNDINFFKIYYNNFYKIMNYNTNMDKINILKLYCHIISRIRRNNYTNINDFNNKILYDKGLRLIEEAHITYDDFHKSINISNSSTMLNKYLSVLKELELIYYDNIGKVVNKYGEIINSVNVYCENEYELQRALIYEMKYYLKNDYKIISNLDKNI